MSLLEAMGSPLWACCSVVAAVAAELCIVLELDPGLAGAGLLAGAIAALAVGLPRACDVPPAGFAGGDEFVGGLTAVRERGKVKEK